MIWLDFLLAWFTGLHNPVRMIEMLKGKPAPLWGLKGTLLRALLDSLLVYLPLAIMGREPTFPSWLSFVSTDSYYSVSVFLFPVYLVGLWLLLSSLIHLIIRISGFRSNIDQIMNISGMAALIVGSVLVFWDWIWIAAGWKNEILLGISHILFSVWALVIASIGFKRILGLSTRFSIFLNVIWILAGMPLSMIFVRPPV